MNKKNLLDHYHNFTEHAEQYAGPEWNSRQGSIFHNLIVKPLCEVGVTKEHAIPRIV